MARGFVLMQLMITLVVSAMLSTALLFAIMQMSQSKIVLNTVTGVYGRIAIVQNQMERDVMSAFIPAQVDLLQTSTEKKEQEKPLEKIFYGTSREPGHRMELLTFITSSPLEVFYGVKNTQPKPRVARVVYRLVPDERHANSFILMRQEGTTNLQFDAYKQDATGSLRSFALIDGIQDFSISYVAIEVDAKEEKQTRVFKKTNSWDSTPKKEQKEASERQQMFVKKEQVKLPNQLEMKLTLWDSTFENTRMFEFVIPIAYKASEYEQPPQEQKKQEKKDEQQQSEAGDEKKA